MPAWPDLFRVPEDSAATAHVLSRFTAIADQLLNRMELLVARQPYRLLEVEFYLHSAAHPDPFTHRQPLQLQFGRWYQHRSGNTLRGGSFKGLDLTFGDGTATAGILFRSLATPEGRTLCGPSLCVDHLLHALVMDRVAELDQALDGRLAWDSDSPLSLREAKATEHGAILSTPRVGLSLKKARPGDERPRFLMRPYRFVSEPRRVSKGKPHMVLAMHIRGADEVTIQQVTGSPMASIRRYLADFEAGRGEDDFTRYFGVEVGPRSWCRLYGTWQSVFG